MRHTLIVLLAFALLVGCGDDAPPVPTQAQTDENPFADPATQPGGKPGTPETTPTTPTTPGTPPAPGTPGSGQDRVFDMEPITSQGALLNQLTAMYSELLPIPPDQIACPPNAPLTAGSTFTCQVTADGVTFTADVQFTQNGVFRTEPRSVMSIPAIAAQIGSGIQQQTGVGARVTCQSTRIRISVPGETFFCTAALAGQRSRQIRVTVQDTNGNVNWEVI